MAQSIRWIVKDTFGNKVYLTQERWNHITESTNHPEMEDYEKELKETIQTGARKQDPLNPQKYRYSRSFDHLPSHNTHIIAIVLFGLRENNVGKIEANNFIVTAYQKEIG